MLQLLFIPLFTSILFGSQNTNESNNNSLIVYDTIGLVHEKSSIQIKKTDKNIIYSNVASSIINDSVNIKLDNSIKIYSQQYRFDKLTKNKLFQAHIDKEILANNKKVILLSVDGDSCLVKNSYGQIYSVQKDNVIFTHIPKELVTKPSLIWNIKANKDLNTTLKLDYLIKNIGFKSSYILNIDDNKADLTGWLNINNRSGKSFKNTKLFILAGDVNQVHKEINLYQQYRAVKVMNSIEKIDEQSYEGYHLYKIPFRVNLTNNEKTQIKFLRKDALKIKRKYKSNMSNPLYLHGQKTNKVSKYLYIEGLDVALPNGIIRTYSKLKYKTIFLGENRITNISKNIPINIKIGNDFDIIVKETIKQRTDTKQYFDVDMLYIIKNNSQKNKEIEIIVPFQKNRYNTINTKQKYTVIDSNKIVFTLIVEANSSKSFMVNYKSRKIF